MPTVREISEQFVDDYAEIDPNFMSLWGVARSATKLTDYSPEGLEATTDLLRRVRNQLDNATAADEVERLGAAVLDDWARTRLGLLESGERSAWLTPLFGAQVLIASALELMPRDTDDDWERVTERLDAVPLAMSQYVDGLRHAADRGIAPQQRLVDVVAAQCRTWSGHGEPGRFSSFVDSYGDGPLAARLAAAGSAADAAYGSFADWLEQDYRAQATDVEGVGEERYRIWAADTLGTANLDLDEVYAWGWDELARIEVEQARECERILPGASMAEVVEHLERPEACIEGVDAWRDWLQQTTDEAIAALDGTEFDIAPELRRCDVVIPQAGSAAAPNYTPPSEDLSAPGRANFPTMGRERFATWVDVTTVYHEAVPGHHLQQGLTRILPLTRFHRLAMNSAHGEGWALYAERLVDELGWFDTPDTRLGYLSVQALRAARVVIDIGLHTGRRIPYGRPDGGEVWTYDRAVDAFMRASGLARLFAESEIARYLSWPSQAISYKLGERVWLDARTQAEQRAGANFDRKSWHAAALALGTLGLDRLTTELAALTPEPSTRPETTTESA
jgi:uncharacterized protein (DUF885 family)